MNPTQAQIEAARLAIADIRKCYLPCACYRNQQHGDCSHLATDALTAAAEVGENGLLARIKELENGLHEYACTGTDQPCGCYELYMKDKNIAAATIERCAQVADKMAPEPDGTPDGIWTATDSKLLHLANDIAAEIRALKDKTQTDPNIIYPGKDLTNVFPEEDA